MKKKSLVEALSELPKNWFKLSPEVKRMFELAQIEEEASKKAGFQLGGKLKIKELP